MGPAVDVTASNGHHTDLAENATLEHVVLSDKTSTLADMLHKTAQTEEAPNSSVINVTEIYRYHLIKAPW